MNYYEIDYVPDYNPKTMSAKISCDNMSSLSCTYTSQQNHLFADKINMDICNYHNNYNRDVDEIKAGESELLKGFSINKKSCIYKRPEYNNGDWKNQYLLSNTFKTDANTINLFDYQTKSRVQIN
jgi:hypothetical protein